MNIFVAKLSPETTGEDLRTLFEQYGSVETAKVIFDHETGNSRGFGFVEMTNDDEGHDAVNALHDTDIHGSRVVIKEARPQGEYQAEQRQDDRGGFVPRTGYDRAPYPGNRGYDNNRGYDRGGYNKGGYAPQRGGYDNNRGYDRGGYNKGGYDNNRGYDRGGYNKGGYDNNRGYDRGGYNKGGYDNNRGYDRGGYDKGGYDNNRGYDRGGYDNRNSPFPNNRDRFQADRRPQNRDDDDLYRFEEFSSNNNE